MTQRQIDSARLLYALRAHLGAGRWQASSVLAAPALAADVEAACGPLNARELGHLLALLARQGAPLVHLRASGQSFWQLTAADANTPPCQRPECALSPAVAATARARAATPDPGANVPAHLLVGALQSSNPRPAARARKIIVEMTPSREVRRVALHRRLLEVLRGHFGIGATFQLRQVLPLLAAHEGLRSMCVAETRGALSSRWLDRFLRQRADAAANGIAIVPPFARGQTGWTLQRVEQAADSAATFAP